ncbi:MAG: 7-carboxy-7-deazaguanine synthase QueE [Bacteroidota bacterium]|nr:7-carboxy-7-deazaguanine synthase QueE [Bacteroidota bacterium]
MSQRNPKNLIEGKELPLMEAFNSIQGEGFHSGSSAYFLRIGGCDVGCHWCDVKESWDASRHPLISIDDIINDISSTVKTVVITGGEPLMYNLSLLTSRLKEKDIQIHLETSGAYPLSGLFDWICVSPKKKQNVLDKIKPMVDELKIIVSNKHDMKWAETQEQEVNNLCKLYLQPEWSKQDIMLPHIIEYVQKNPKWKISLQTHKYMKIP